MDDAHLGLLRESVGDFCAALTTHDDAGLLVAVGGRVLALCATGASFDLARDAAYAGVDAIEFPDGFCRRDIGWRALD